MNRDLIKKIEEESYYDEKGNKYYIICEKCGKYKYYIGWGMYDDTKICHCRDYLINLIRDRDLSSLFSSPYILPILIYDKRKEQTIYKIILKFNIL